MTPEQHKMWDEGYIAGLSSNEPEHQHNPEYMEGYYQGKDELEDEMYMFRSYCTDIEIEDES